MPISSLTAITPIPEGSEATPGLWNSRFSQLQQNLQELNIQAIGLLSGFVSGGVGSPESVQTANPGGLYVQSDATTGEHPLWVKFTGSGTTGWIGYDGFKGTGADSYAFGRGAGAAGENSSAFGRSAAAGASASQAWGYLASATKDSDIAVGPNSRASGPNALAIGLNTFAGFINAGAVGSAVTSNATGGWGFGTGTQVSHQSALVFSATGGASQTTHGLYFDYPTSTFSGLVSASTFSGIGAIRDWVNLADHGILQDGTDQTSAMTAFFVSLGSQSRHLIYIPYNTEYSMSSAWPWLPPTSTVVDYSSRNFFYSGATDAGYKQKSFIFGALDRTNDDTAFVVQSGHHPAVILNNLGFGKESSGSTTTSAAQRVGSLIYSGGLDSANNPVLIWQMSNEYNNGSGVTRWQWLVRARSNYSQLAISSDSATANAIDLIQLAIDEEGFIGMGSRPENGMALAVAEAPGQARTDTNVKIKNTQSNAASEANLIFETKTAGGAVVRKRLRATNDNKLAFRDSGNSSNLLSIDDVGNLRLSGTGRLSIVSVTPATGTSAGTAGDIAWGLGSGTTFLYVCVSANSWFRTALSPF